MTNKRAFDFLIGLIFLSLLGLYLHNRYSPPARPKIVIRPKMIKTKDILKRKGKIPEAFLNTTATSSACTLFLKNSAELSMSDYVNEFINHQIYGILKTCKGAFPTLLQQHIDKGILECKTSTRETISTECYSALLEAKNSTVATIIKIDANPNELAPFILLHLLADKFATGDFLEHPERSLTIVNALLDKEPNYLNAYKAKLLLLSMSSLSNEEHYQNMFQDTLDEAKRLSSNDPEIKEIALIEKGGLFKQATEQNSAEKELADKENRRLFIIYLEQESMKYPTEWIYDYYKANALYSDNKDDTKNNYEQVVALIEKALTKFPHNNRLKQTLDNLKSDDDHRRKHPFIINIGLNLNDL
jgi:hypothetical protein